MKNLLSKMPKSHLSRAGALAALVLLAAAGASPAASKVTLAWNANAESDVAGYRVRYGTSAANLDHSIDAGGGTSYSVTGLAPGVTYYFATTAYNTQGLESLPSALISYAAPVDPVKLSWDANTEPDIRGYRVYFGTSSGNLDQSVDVGAATTFSVANLVPGATYYFATTAYNSQGLESLPSNTVSYTVPSGSTEAAPSVSGATAASTPPGSVPTGTVGTGSSSTLGIASSTTSPAPTATARLAGSGTVLRLRADGRSFRSGGFSGRPLMTKRGDLQFQASALGGQPAALVYRVRKGRYRAAPGSGSPWIFTAKLRVGRNRIEACAIDANNIPRAGVRLTVTREKRD